MVRSARSMAGEQSGPVSPPELQAQLAAIEAALERGDYKPGPWQKLTDELRNRDQAERAALADDLTRVSRKLHLRRHRYTMSVLSGVLLEALAGILGGILIAAGVASTSNSLAIVGMLLWVACFEPLLKLGVGTALSVQYDYAYLYGGVEPRFKPSFGSYLALTPLKRVVLQIAGMVGSPLGVGRVADSRGIATCRASRFLGGLLDRGSDECRRHSSGARLCSAYRTDTYTGRQCDHGDR
jgi:hypothetical protein